MAHVESTLKWTGAQRTAIEACDRSLLVSAAAGSGKTAVLAERCAFLVCDAPELFRCDVDQLLVVTFTNAAAAEMRARIEQALRQRLAKQDDPRLQRQLALLDRAQISTIHSFCSAVLKKHFNLLGLDPAFRTLDEDDAALLRIETARQLLAARYDAEDGDAFRKLVDCWADGYDQRLLQQIIATHSMLESIVDAEGWLKGAHERLAGACSENFLNTELGRDLVEHITSTVGDLLRRCRDASRNLSRSRPRHPYLTFVRELQAAVEEIDARLRAGCFDDLAAPAESLRGRRLPPLRQSVPGKEAAKAMVDALRDELKPSGRVYELCRFNVGQWQEGIRSSLPAAGVFLDLVREYGRRYQAAKREAGGVDFSDLERLTLQVFNAGTSPGELFPSSAARTYQIQFRHVLVDEYQDINEVQDAILWLASGESRPGANGGNLFCVGDVKQSIYRFRLADPRRFLERRSRLGRSDNATGQVVDLQDNFRSRAPLLDALNQTFERIMTAAAAEIEYDHSQRLNPGAAYPQNAAVSAFAGAPIELHLLPENIDGNNDGPDDAAGELDRTEREAAFVAQRIRTLMGLDSGVRTHVLDKASGNRALRPLAFGDIVILLRAVKHKTTQFAAALRSAGVPVHADGGGGFFASMEIRDMLALLSLLDNLQQDIPLAAVLRSPLGALPDAEDSLARIRIRFPGSVEEPIPFHQAVASYADRQSDELAAHLRDFLSRIEGWRDLARRRPLAELIWTIYDQTGYLAFCAGLPDGEQRAANLVRLHERARQFGSFQRQGLRRFMQFLESLQEEEREMGEASVLSEAEDAVRVMSIHRSKGLEFPVVIIPDLGKRHNLQDTRGTILVDRQAGLGLMAVNETLRIRYPSAASVLVEERIRRQSLAEELRVLYVAMTRAREHLILVATCREDRPQKWREQWARHEGAFPAEDILRSGCMLDWVGPVAAATAHHDPAPFQISVYGSEDMRQYSQAAARKPALTDQQQRCARLEPLAPPPPDNQHAEHIKQQLTFIYPHRSLTTLAAARTVGSMAKSSDSSAIGAAAFTDDGPLALPRSAAGSARATAAEIGSATHLVLQHLDFARSCTMDDLRSQIQHLIERRYIAPEQAQTVDLDAIAWFVQTPLGNLLRRHSRDLLRELSIYFPHWETPPTSDPLDQVMVRGRIDVLIRDPGGIVVVDYKTDRITRPMLAQRTGLYRPQVQAYSRAIGGILREAVGSVELVFLAAREIVSLKP